MKKWLWLVLFCPSIAFASEFPLEEYIEVASLVKRPQSKVGKSTEVIDHTIFEDYRLSGLTESFHNVPGVYVKRTGGDGALTNVRFRGARSIDTKVLYNGVSLSDPSDTQGSPNPLIGDLASLSQEIEIVKGASSSVWGSEALGGVFNIRPKKGGKDESRITAEFGSFSTFTEKVEVANRVARASIYRRDSEGFDAHDSYENTSGEFNLTLMPVDYISVELFGRGGETTARLNDSPFIFGGQLIDDVDDSNDRREYWMFIGGVDTKVRVNEAIEVRNRIGWLDSDRRFVFLPDDEFDFHSDGTFHGNTVSLHNQVSVKHGEHFTTTGGHLYERQWYELETLGESDQADKYSNDFFLEEAIDIDNLHLILAIRENTNEQSKSRTTFDISGVYEIPNISTRLQFHFGTGYRTPALYELYGAFLTGFGRFEVGNNTLGPERAKSLDFGFKSRVTPTTDLGATFFTQSVRNKIDFVGLRYENVDGVDSTHGVELFLEKYLMDGLSFRTSYTYTDGDNLVDIPGSVWDASIRYKKDKWTANVKTRYEISHTMMVFNLDDFTVGRIEEDGHFGVDATVAYKLKPDLEVYLKAENLLGSDYTVGGYKTPGARVYGGITWTY